jgi:HD-GYP domain-containing protein (c-di-GMP phosphodiesterase class II)
MHTMIDTQALMEKIACLRRQLEEVQDLAKEPGSAAAPGKSESAARVWRLERQVSAGSTHLALLDSTLKELAPGAESAPAPPLPKQLTSHARRLIETGRKQLEELRELATALETGQAPTELAEYYRITAAMADAAIRMIQSFPDAPSPQLRLSEGVEPFIELVAGRITLLQTALARHRVAAEQVERLAEALTGLHQDKGFQLTALEPLADLILQEARSGAALTLQYSWPGSLIQLVACHSLCVARVIARISRLDPELQRQPRQPVLAALVHDVGMLALGEETMMRQGPLTDGERRALEGHTTRGAEFLARHTAGNSDLAEAAALHHERLDGTGYPRGLRQNQLGSLARLLAVCDVYAALAAPRPWRAAFGTRTAMTDTLLLADRNKLDRYHAERLLQLSFYPVGTAVELADGAVGVVIATNMNPRDVYTPARPVVAILADRDGRLLPQPHHLDLGSCEGRSIVRSLPAAERSELLGKRYPDLVRSQ